MFQSQLKSGLLKLFEFFLFSLALLQAALSDSFTCVMFFTELSRSFIYLHLKCQLSIHQTHFCLLRSLRDALLVQFKSCSDPSADLRRLLSRQKRIIIWQLACQLSFSEAEFLQLQDADLQSVLESLVFELHGPCVRGHILRVCRRTV